MHKLIALLPLWMLAVSSCCREASAQIAIKESRQAYWSFPGAEIVSGQVVAPVDAKPKLDRVETTIRVETVVEYKFGQLKARKLPNYERVTLDEVSKGVFKFKPGAPEGTYLLEYNAFDPEKGIASDEATVTLEKSGPLPGPEPLPEPDGLSEIAKQSRAKMAAFASMMAADMDKAALEVESGRIKNVIGLASFTVPLDEVTRKAFKKSMEPVVSPRLGVADLPVDAPKTLREVAAGFRSVK